MRKNVSHLQRIEDCLSGNSQNGTPVALWRHFPVDDQDPATLAGAHLDFQRTYDFDLLKVTPASSYMAKDWGVNDEWRGATEGTREYTRRIIKKPEDWADIPILSPSRGSLLDSLEALKIITKELGDKTPVIQTIFSPLSQAKNLVGREQLVVHLRKFPEEIHAGLKIIAETTMRYIEACRETGIAGIFYAVQHAQLGILSVQEYSEFGRKYDMDVLEAAEDLWLNMLHLHGENIMFEQFVDYPVAVINWHDQDTPPSLEEARSKYKGVVCGGLQREQTLVIGTPDTVLREAQQALEITGGRKHILGTGCVTPTIAPRANILAARKSVDLV